MLGNKINRLIIAAAALIAAAAMSISCTKTGTQDTISVSLDTTEAGASASQQFVRVSCTSTVWTLSIKGDCSWARLSVVGNTNVLSWDANDSEESRSLVIEAVCTTAPAPATCTFRQAGKTNPGPGPTPGPTDLNPDPVANWMELPAMSDGLYFFTHDMSVGSYKGRNYSFALDPNAFISSWVAYPLNSKLIGSGSRTNDWGLDPKVPRKYQSVIFSGYKGGYERGHQLPSADRYSANTSTFYGTNMTPQSGALNEHSWATLEGYVRDWAKSFDTLYVVTGADYSRSTKYATDNDGKKVVVPTGYYKALLGYKKGGTIGLTPATGGYTGIAFYCKHQSYNDSAIMSEWRMTIDDLEKKMNIDFFVNLPAAIGEDLAAKVESTTDSWWK